LALFSAGVTSSIGSAAMITVIATNTPANMQGRMFSVQNLLNFAALGSSIMLAGIAVEFIGPRLCGVLGTSIILLFSFTYVFLITRGRANTSASVWNNF
jgi:hypothetical protein